MRLLIYQLQAVYCQVYSEDNTTYNSPRRVFIGCRTTFVNLMKMLSFYKPACLNRQKVNICHTFAAENEKSHFKVFKVFCLESRISKEKCFASVQFNQCHFGLNPLALLLYSLAGHIAKVYAKGQPSYIRL